MFPVQRLLPNWRICPVKKGDLLLVYSGAQREMYVKWKRTPVQAQEQEISSFQSLFTTREISWKDYRNWPNKRPSLWLYLLYSVFTQHKASASICKYKAKEKRNYWSGAYACVKSVFFFFFSVKLGLLCLWWCWHLSFLLLLKARHCFLAVI